MGPAEIRSESLVATLRREVAGLSPAYFALVMATGIFSIGVTQLGAPILGAGLYALNIGLYVLLAGLTALRIAWFAPDVLADLTDHRRSVGFFTVVAATNILGSQCLLIGGGLKIAVALWVVGLMLWAGLTYAIFVTLTVKSEKPPLNEGITGAWLLAIVATQSVALLSALLAAHWPQPYRLELNFLALSMWLWGGMFYIWMISLIFYRYTFFAFSPDDLSPPYWINMGAMAISTLAGSLLIINVPDAPFLLSLLPFIKGFTVLYWATGTWWIPMLVVLALWRHVYRRFPLRYDPLYWGAVFPLGMYAAGTHELIEAMGFPFLRFLPVVFLYVALAAWLAAFLGLAHDLLRRASARS